MLTSHLRNHAPSKHLATMQSDVTEYWIKQDSTVQAFRLLETHNVTSEGRGFIRQECHSNGVFGTESQKRHHTASPPKKVGVPSTTAIDPS